MTQKTHLRLWPGVVIVLLVASYAIPMFLPEAFLFGMIGGLVGALAIIVWGVFFSRTPWSERVGAVILMALALAATKRFLHGSMATAGVGPCGFRGGVAAASRGAPPGSSGQRADGARVDSGSTRES